MLTGVISGIVTGVIVAVLTRSVMAILMYAIVMLVRTSTSKTLDPEEEVYEDQTMSYTEGEVENIELSSNPAYEFIDTDEEPTMSYTEEVENIEL